MVKSSIGLLKAKRPTDGLKSEELGKNHKTKVDLLKKVRKSCFIKTFEFVTFKDQQLAFWPLKDQCLT